MRQVVEKSELPLKNSVQTVCLELLVHEFDQAVCLGQNPPIEDVLKALNLMCFKELFFIEEPLSR